MGEVLSCCATQREENGKKHRKSRHSRAVLDEEVEKKLDEATKDSGDLTKEDRELLKALLKDLVAPDDVNLKVESSDGKPVYLQLQMANRLVVEGAGAKTRRFPFNSMRNVQFGEKGGRDCFQIDYEVPLPGESGTVTYYLLPDSGFTNKQIAQEVRDIIDTVSQDDYPLANFGVLKINPQGKHQARLLQIDLPNRLLSNVHKGDIKSQFHFSEVSGVEDTPETSNFTLFFRDYRPYEFVCQTLEDKNVLLKIFRSISVGSYTVANLTHDDLNVIPFWPAKAIFSGPADKKGDLSWDHRHLVLTKSRLFIFRQKGSRNPLNCITLLGASVEKGSDESVFSVSMKERDFKFRAPSKTARDIWFGHIKLACEKASGNYHRYLSQTLKTALDAPYKASAHGSGGHGHGGHGGGGGGGGSSEGAHRKHRSSSRGRRSKAADSEGSN